MNEVVGTDEGGYCAVAEDIMEFAGHQNMTAGRLEKPLIRKGLPVPNPEKANQLARMYRGAAQAADALVRECVRCTLTRIHPDMAQEECPVGQDFAKLQANIAEQITRRTID